MTRLDRVIAQASAIGSVPFADGAQEVHFAFAGPSHVATLLRRLICGVRDAMLVRTPPPGGIDGAAWSTWVHSQAETRPFL